MSRFALRPYLRARGYHYGDRFPWRHRGDAVLHRHCRVRGSKMHCLRCYKILQPGELVIGTVGRVGIIINVDEVCLACDYAEWKRERVIEEFAR